MTLDELRLLERGATGGEWVYQPDLGGVYVRHSPDAPWASVARTFARDEGEFIAAARNAMPVLLEVVEAGARMVRAEEAYFNKQHGFLPESDSSWVPVLRERHEARRAFIDLIRAMGVTL